jgi:hypothetical protein
VLWLVWHFFSRCEFAIVGRADQGKRFGEVFRELFEIELLLLFAKLLVGIDLNRLAALYDDAGAGAEEIRNLGGCSDAVFEVISAFLADDAERFVAEIESNRL